MHLCCLPLILSTKFENFVDFHIIFSDFYLPRKRNWHISLRFGTLLNLAKEFGRSPPSHAPIFQYRSILNVKIWFIYTYFYYIPRRKSGIYWIQVRRAAAVEISLWAR